MVELRSAGVALGEEGKPHPAPRQWGGREEWVPRPPRLRSWHGLGRLPDSIIAVMPGLKPPPPPHVPPRGAARSRRDASKGGASLIPLFKGERGRGAGPRTRPGPQKSQFVLFTEPAALATPSSSRRARCSSCALLSGDQGHCPPDPLNVVTEELGSHSRRKVGAAASRGLISRLLCLRSQD
ncbi:RING finger protein 227 isoform X2 [Macaca mulatta]